MIGTETATIENPSTEEDRYDNDVFVYDGTPVTVTGCLFEPAGSIELRDGRESVTTTPRLYLPSLAPITAVSRVTVRGDEYEVDGEPADWQVGIVATLKRAVG